MAFRRSPNEREAAEPYRTVVRDLESPLERRLHAYRTYPYMTSAGDRFGYEDDTIEFETPSLQRFLREPDQSPFTSHFLSTKEMALFGETSRGSVYGVYSPWSTMTDTNPDLPEDSSCSSSSGTSWPANSSLYTRSPELLQQSFAGLMSRLRSQQGLSYPQGSLSPSFLQDSSMGGSGITLRDVEKSSEAEPAQDPTCLEFPAFSSSSPMYPNYPDLVQLGYDHSHSIEDDEYMSDAAEDLDSTQPSPKQHENDPQYQPSSSTPTQSCRRGSSRNSTEATFSRSSNKGYGSAPVGALSLASPTTRRGRNKRRSTKQHTNPQAFPCPLAAYGCHITFSSKNEWKRHVTSKHVLLEHWRCELCPPSESRGPNVFNRKDLFTQHLRRMHGPQSHSESDGPPLPKRRRSNVVSEGDEEFEKSLESIRNRCWFELRSAPTASSCLFCPETFSGQGSWQKRLDHVGLHMENAIKGNGTAIKERNARIHCDNSAEGDSDTISVKHEHSNTISVKHEHSDTIPVKHEQAVGVPPPSQWNVDHALEAWMLAQGLLKRIEDGKYVLVSQHANELKLDGISLGKRRLTEDDDAEGEYE